MDLDTNKIFNMQNVTSSTLEKHKDNNVYYQVFNNKELIEPLDGYWWRIECGGGEGDGSNSYVIYSMRKYIPLTDKVEPIVGEKYITSTGVIPRIVKGHSWVISPNNLGYICKLTKNLTI